MKDEIKQAKAAAQALKAEGLTLEQIMHRLNVEFYGFYHVVRGQLVRDHDKDYLPAWVIL